MTPALTMNNVTKKYQNFTLDHINITLPNGCIMGFIGENGAGKSTTIKLLLDLISKDSGEISVLGTDPCQGDKAWKEQIGTVMDECCFPDHLTVKDINLILKKSFRTWEEKVFFNYITKFSLPPQKQVKDYSRGMKMKLSIAVALSHGSKLLILDEATSGLDPIIRDEILDVFMDFIQNEEHSIFISSHILSDLEKTCDYITFIHEGKIVFSKAKDDLLEQFGLLKCGEEHLSALDHQAVVGVRKNSFGVEALVYRERVPEGFLLDPVSIEDIMVYFVKEYA